MTLNGAEIRHFIIIFLNEWVPELVQIRANVYYVLIQCSQKFHQSPCILFLITPRNIPASLMNYCWQRNALARRSISGIQITLTQSSHIQSSDLILLYVFMSGISCDVSNPTKHSDLQSHWHPWCFIPKCNNINQTSTKATKMAPIIKKILQKNSMVMQITLKI